MHPTLSCHRHPPIDRPGRPHRARHWLCTAVLAVGATAAAAWAGPPADAAAPVGPAAAAAASSAASAVTRPMPRPATPEQAARRAERPGELRPAQPVVPQIRLQAGPAAPAPAAAPPQAPGAAVPAGVIVPRGGIDDALARCRAATDPAERERCVEELSVRGRPAG
ncbi:hypothetical protein [Piscinibacter sakaiensis]|uniref:Translation initiation factor 2 n=1 Tax=Piscinibacter sakaiensis TaxID=1547922 RepID=A0A0K8P3Q6_PISS1|nr:hypothetical protein [Piscinibacter sakaiensis]GAP37206.1 translation initiation factor 2 [Piscinibacter sakaiensis]